MCPAFILSPRPVLPALIVPGWLAVRRGRHLNRRGGCKCADSAFCIRDLPIPIEWKEKTTGLQKDMPLPDSTPLQAMPQLESIAFDSQRTGPAKAELGWRSSPIAFQGTVGSSSSWGSGAIFSRSDSSGNSKIQLGIWIPHGDKPCGLRGFYRPAAAKAVVLLAAQDVFFS